MKIHTQVIIVLVIAIAAFAPRPSHAGEPDKTPTLAIVHTWGELLAQPPITLGPATIGSSHVGQQPTYRLGIDCSRADRYGGAVIYCLVTGPYKPAMKQNFLGPFSVEVKYPAEFLTPAVALRQISTADAPTHLLLKVIPLNQSGDYTINIREPLDDKSGKDDKPATDAPIIATATITVSKTQSPVWSTWDDVETEAADTDLQDKKADDGHYEWDDVSAPSATIGLPGWLTGESIPIAAPPDAKLPLPQLIPATPDPGIHLAIQGNWLTVKFDKPITDVAASADHFLTRWWVNGKAFTPEIDGVVNVEGGGEQAAPSPASEVRFRIQFHPDLLHAKKGDTIGVQLLHCPQGYIQNGTDEPMTSDPDDTDPALSRLTPRLEFTYTGDPAAIAAPEKAK